MNNRCKLLRSRLIANLLVHLNVRILQGPYVVTDLVKRFAPKQYDKKEFKKVTAAVVWNYAVYGFHVDEFFIYDVESLSDLGKRKFINEETRWKYYAKLNRKEDEILFDNKMKTYGLFKKYYHRELLFVESADKRSEFDAFIKKYPSLIIKPLASSGGKGVKLFNGEGIEELLKEYKEGFVMEPRMVNETEFAEFHKESLNTVRIVSVRMDNRVEIAYAFARLGKNGACIDNARSGGIISALDVDTGIVVAAIDEANKSYIVHPNSGKRIIGFRVPKWEELKSLVKELAQIVPTTRYVGWDMALTPEGWVVIEANCKGQFVVQMATKKGIREQFEGYLKELDA